MSVYGNAVPVRMAYILAKTILYDLSSIVTFKMPNIKSLATVFNTIKKSSI